MQKPGLGCLILLTAAASALAAGPTTRSRPNFVFILVDDLRWDAMSCAGHPFARTPNIDKLATSGARFTNAFVTLSLCGPSRATFMTGTYAHINGVTTNEGQEFDFKQFATYPMLLQKEGYRTGFVGKWHMKPSADPRPGFDYWLSFRGQGVYNDPQMNENGRSFKAKGYITDILTDHAVAFIKETKDKPFCLSLWHKAVHGPFTPADRHRNLYADASLPEPKNFRDNLAGKPAWQRGRKGGPTPAAVEAGKWDGRADRFIDYFRAEAAVDESVGRVLQALADTGQLENTYVLFAGDNGYFHGEHQRGDKRAAYEESVRIPFVMQGPGIAGRGRLIEQTVLNTDFAPTLLDLAGVRAAPTMQGRSFKPLLAGATSPWENTFLYEYFHEPTAARIPTMVGVRTPEWKYITYPGTGDIDELYDLTHDRQEMKNLAEDPGAKDTLARMKGELERHKKAVGYVSAATQPATQSDAGHEAAPVDTRADTWAATDALGRALPHAKEAGPPRAGKFVGAFYFLWMGQHGTDGPYDVTKIFAADPEAMQHPTSPPWGPLHRNHHWGESLMGYYLSDDRWVLAKHAQMLADAGVDTLIFDVTNQITYQKVYLTLCDVFTQMRARGCRTPQIAFLCPFGDPSKVVAELYANLYAPGRYSDLWFQWKSKPLILADPARVPAETRDFFTFRKPQPDYFVGPTGPNQWGWLEIYPQHAFTNEKGQPEEVAVGVGQNASGRRLCAFSEPNTYGRSWHDGKKDERPDAVMQGPNFAEQWKRALEIDPEFIFITGWNEWIATRFTEFAGVKSPIVLVDEFTQEYSRDVEPMKGGHGDNYYYQMVSNIRRFKGVRPPQPAGPPSTIKIDGDFADWRDVQPEYRDDAGDTMHRDHPGHQNNGQYKNNTGRNDFVALKVGRTEKSACFYARTAGPITPRADGCWMVLLIDTDRDARTGWCGFDLAINRAAGAAGTARVERCTGGWNWAAAGEAPLRVGDRELELEVSRELLGAAAAAGELLLRFKWIDNMQMEGDPLEFIVNGDAAPNGRFMYVYE